MEFLPSKSFNCAVGGDIRVEVPTNLSLCWDTVIEKYIKQSTNWIIEYIHNMHDEYVCDSGYWVIVTIVGDSLHKSPRSIQCLLH